LKPPVLSGPYAQWVRPLATLAVMLVLVTVFAPSFWENNYPVIMMRQFAVIGILATGMTLVIISGGIDLSVGSLLALSASVFAETVVMREWHPAFGALAALAATGAIGAVNGIVITRLGIQPFIVTLAAMIGARGLARWYVDNATIDIGFGESFVARTVKFIAQESVVVPSFLAVVLIGLVLLNMTRFGRHIVAVGGSEDAAHLSGIATDWVKVRVYALSGLFAGFAGILHCAQNRQGNPNDGIAYELDAIAAAVIGGTSLAGGKGGMFGTLVGTLSLGILISTLRLRGLDENVQWMLKAVIIVAAVWLQVLGTRRRA